MALGEVATLGSSVDAWRNGLRPAFGVPRVTESPKGCPEGLTVLRGGCVVRLAVLAALSQPMALGKEARSHVEQSQSFCVFVFKSFSMSLRCSSDSCFLFSCLLLYLFSVSIVRMFLLFSSSLSYFLLFVFLAPRVCARCNLAATALHRTPS